MPTYEYRCAKCGEELEVFQSFSDTPLTRHEACGGKLDKVLHAAGVILKGSGFYKTDNRSSAKKSGEKTEKSEKSGSSSGSDSSSSSSGSSSSKGDGSSSSSKESSGSSDSKPAAKSA
jgi:putative FmdB family regulatory protein